MRRKPYKIAKSALNRTAGTSNDIVMSRIADVIGLDGEKTVKHMSALIWNELLPHCGISNASTVVQRKLVFFSSMNRRLVSVLSGETEPDDRDATSNKCVCGIGA